MKIIVLLGQKGGTGKSTIATHLAVCAARDGKAVALFDIDPQASAAKWSDRRTAEGPPVVRAGAAHLPNLVQQAREQGADVILIDTAGHADASNLHALQLADLVLIPCRPSAADLDAIEDTITLAQRAKQGKAAVVINASPFNIVIAGRAARSLPHDRPSRSRCLEAVLLCDRIEIGRGNVSTHVESPARMGERLLLDSRVVDMPMASNPNFVLLSSLKPLFLVLSL
jgi:chromosome partitioning protein